MYAKSSYDKVGMGVKLLGVCMAIFFVYQGEWKYSLFVVPVFVLDICIPRANRTDTVVSIFKLFLLFQGLGIWYLNSVSFFGIPINEIQNSPVFQREFGWQNASTMLRGMGERTIQSLVNAGASGHSSHEHRFSGAVYPVKVLAGPIRVNEYSMELLNDTFGAGVVLLTTDFPDLKHRSSSAVRRRFPQVFAELPAEGFDHKYKNPCWVRQESTNSGTNSGGARSKNNDNIGKLACLPYAYILGQPKSGTSDLFERLKGHSDIM